MGPPSKKKQAGGSLADINVTPLVDILLVLLIIFMVTAPMIHHGTSVNTPDVTPQEPRQPPPEESQKTTLFIDQARTLSYRDKKINDLGVLFRIIREDAAFQASKEKEIYLQADPRLRYGQVMEVISVMRRAGVQRVGMVVSAEDVQE
jgi:biopolymer transport protein TolR